jgi:hypothetical protein
MSVRVIVCALAMSIAFAACGSSGPDGSPCTAFGGVPGGDACGSCQTKSCGGELAAAFGEGWAKGDFSGGACQSLMECASACDCSDTACVSGCGVPSAECQDALQKLAACQGTHCTSECSSSSTSSSSSSGGTTTGTTTGTIPTGSVSVSCYNAAEHGCVQTVVPDYAAEVIKNKCVEEGSVASTQCPTGGLIGCCVLFGGTECFYQGIDSDAQAACALAGGMWSTTP